MTDVPTTPRQRATGQRIVDAARGCFERFGIQKTTIEDIARAAGVSRPTIYKHFPGKSEIIDHISMREMEKVQQTLRERLTLQEGFADRLTEVVLVSVGAAAENPYVRRFVEMHEVTAKTYDQTSPYQLLARERWRTLIERARESGELAADLEFDEIVAWLSFNQVSLLKATDQLTEPGMRRLIRRLVVEPLLADRGR